MVRVIANGAVERLATSRAPTKAAFETKQQQQELFGGNLFRANPAPAVEEVRQVNEASHHQ
jgi:hypothetical protein